MGQLERRNAVTEGKTAPAARLAVGASPPWRQAAVDGVRLAYDDDGDGPAVVCLHAIGHGARDFARLRARLRARLLAGVHGLHERGGQVPRLQSGCLHERRYVDHRRLRLDS